MKRKLNRRFFLVIVLAVCMTLALTAGICYEMFRTQVMEDLAACWHPRARCCPAKRTCWGRTAFA
mgnify:CR=1 FL=1